MKLQKLAIAVAVAGTFVVGTAQAQQQSPWYLGGGIGQSKYEFNNSDFDFSDIGASHSFDDTDTAYKVFVGYQVSPRWGVELGYTNLGSPSVRYTAGGLNARAEHEASAWTLVGTGRFPIANQFSLVGRLGLTRNTAELSGTADAALVAAGFDVENSKKNKTDLTWGIGAQYDFSRKVGLRLDYDNYGKFGDSNTTGRGEADMWSLNVVVGF